MPASHDEIKADDIVRVKQSTLISLHRAAESLPLKSGKVAARLSGNYLSAFKGRGMEFDEARPYQPGDDIRSIDWRVTARTGKAYTKLFREERERPVLLWVDYRHSMFFGSQNSFKSVVAAKIAALLAWSATQHSDRIGGLIFSEAMHQELRPQRGKSATLHFIQKLADHPAWNNFKNPVTDSTSGQHALNRLRRVARPGSLIFLISDFRHMDNDMQSSLAQLTRHNDVVLLFISDPLEASLPPAGYYRVSNGIEEIGINTRNETSRRHYQNKFASHENNLRQLCKRLNMFFLNITTDQPLLSSLQKGLGLKK